MKKSKSLAMILMCLVSILASACNIKLPNNKQKTPEREVKTNAEQVEVYSIDLTVASENSKHVYHAEFPRSKDVVNAREHKVDRVFFSLHKPGIISRDDFNIFYNYAQKLNEKQMDYSQPFLYSITLAYYDEQGEMQNEYYVDYDSSFPEEFVGIVEKFNSMCGEEVFETTLEPLDFGPDFIYKEFGVTPEKYPPEDVQGMLDMSIMSFETLMTCGTGGIEKDMDYYYANREDETIRDLYPTEILDSKYVSEDEMVLFAGRVAEKLGESWEVDQEYRPDDRIYIHNKETDEEFFISSGYYTKNHYNDRYETLEVYYVVGPEDLSFACEFIYNRTGDYIIAEYKSCEGFAEIVRAFYEVE